MINPRYFYLWVPLSLLLPIWIDSVRNHRTMKRKPIVAVVCATMAALWAVSLHVRIALHPALLNEPPWKGINIDAALLGFIGPVAVIAGLVSAFRGARWWHILLIELSSVPLSLIGCAAGISV